MVDGIVFKLCKARNNLQRSYLLPFSYQANKCMLMAAVAYNLKKLLKWDEQKRKTAIMSMKKAEESLCLVVFNLWQLIHPYKPLQTNFAFTKS